MSLNELQEIAQELESVVYEEKTDRYKTYKAEKDRPIGMKSKEWEKLVYAVDDLIFKVNRAIIQQEKQFLTT